MDKSFRKWSKLQGEVTYILPVWVIIPPEVNNEILQLEKFDISLDAYKASNWISVVSPLGIKEVEQLMLDLDKGESEAIALAKELNADYLLIDERLGARKANEIGLKTIGLLGILAKAKEESLVQTVEPIIIQLRSAGFWVSDRLIEFILKRVGER